MTSSSPLAGKNPILKLMGCLIKVPLGCLGFLLGGTTMLVLFLPPSLGKLLHDQFEAKFNANFAGSIELGELWIGSFYDDQRIEGIVLRDPEGGTVLRGSLRAPDLWDLEFGSGVGWGPVRLELAELNLIQAADGSSNLARALSQRGELKASSERIQRRLLKDLRGINAKASRSLMLELSIDRLRWQRGQTEPVLLENLLLVADLKREGWQRRLAADGQVQLSGSSAEPIRFQWHLDDALCYADSPWRLSLGGTDLPLGLLQAVFGSLGDMDSLLGEEIQSLQLKVFGEDQSQRKIEVVLNDEGAKLTLRADWDREAHSLLAKQAQQGASLSLPRDSMLARFALSSAVPLAQDFGLDPGVEELWMHFRDFELPLDGNLKRLRTDCTFEAKSVSFRYQEGLRKAFDLNAREHLEENLSLSVRDGVLIYNGLNLPAKRTTIQVDGGLNLLDGQQRLMVQFERFPVLELDEARALGAWQRSRD